MALTSYALLEKIKIVKRILEKECGCEFAVVYDTLPENVTTLVCDDISFVIHSNGDNISKVSIMSESSGFLSENTLDDTSLNGLISFIKSAVLASKEVIEEMIRPVDKRGVAGRIKNPVSPADIQKAKDLAKKAGNTAADLSKQAASGIADLSKQVNKNVVKPIVGAAKDKVNSIAKQGADSIAATQKYKDSKDFNIQKTDIKKPTSGKFTNAYKQQQKFLADAANKIIGDKATASDDDVSNIITLWLNDPILSGRSAFIKGDIKHIYMMFLAAVGGDSNIRKKIGTSQFNKAAEPFVAQLATKGGEGAGEDPLSPLQPANLSSVNSEIEKILKSHEEQVKKNPEVEEWTKNIDNVIRAMRSAIINPGSSTSGASTQGGVWITSSPGMSKSSSILALMKELGFNVKKIDPVTNESKAKILQKGSMSASDRDVAYIQGGPSHAPGSVVTSQLFFTLRNFPIIIFDDAKGYVSGLGDIANVLFNGGEAIRTLNFGAEDAIKLKTRSRVIVISNDTVQKTMPAQNAVYSRIAQVPFSLTSKGLYGYMGSELAINKFYSPELVSNFKKDGMPAEAVAFFDKDEKKYDSFIKEAIPNVSKIDQVMVTLGKLLEKVGIEVKDPISGITIPLTGNEGFGMRGFWNRLNKSYIPFICKDENNKSLSNQNLVLDRMTLFINNIIDQISKSDKVKLITSKEISSLDKESFNIKFLFAGAKSSPKQISKKELAIQLKGENPKTEEMFHKITKTIMENNLSDLKKFFRLASTQTLLESSEISKRSLYEMLISLIVLKEHLSGGPTDMFLNWADDTLKHLAESDEHRENFTTNLRQYMMDNKVAITEARLFDAIVEHLSNRS